MYDVFPLDLSVITSQTGVDLVKAGITVSEFFMLNLVDGSSFEISLARGPWIEIARPFTMEPSGRAMQIIRDGGIRWRNLAAQPGVVAKVSVFYDAEVNAVLA